MTPPTTTQAALLAYIAKCLEVEHQWPTSSEISADFGWASPNASTEMIHRLETAGHITRNARGKFMLARHRVVIVAPERIAA